VVHHDPVAPDVDHREDDRELKAARTDGAGVDDRDALIAPDLIDAGLRDAIRRMPA
jgi:hypothetical protein